MWPQRYFQHLSVLWPFNKTHLYHYLGIISTLPLNCGKVHMIPIFDLFKSPKTLNATVLHTVYALFSWWTLRREMMGAKKKEINMLSLIWKKKKKKKLCYFEGKCSDSHAYLVSFSIILSLFVSLSHKGGFCLPLWLQRQACWWGWAWQQSELSPVPYQSISLNSSPVLLHLNSPLPRPSPSLPSSLSSTSS